MPAEPLTPERIEEIDAREKAATPGPWKISTSGDGQKHVMASCVHGGYESGVAGSDGDWAWGSILYNREDFNVSANMEFCAHARTDIPALRAEIDRQAEEIRAANERTKELEGQIADALAGHGHSNTQAVIATLKAKAESAERELAALRGETNAIIDCRCRVPSVSLLDVMVEIHGGQKASTCTICGKQIREKPYARS